jgi:hypothetical protein
MGGEKREVPLQHSRALVLARQLYSIKPSSQRRFLEIAVKGVLAPTKQTFSTYSVPAERSLPTVLHLDLQFPSHI